MYYMGIDVGSSGCKAVVFDTAGRQLVAAYREYDVRFTPDGGAELNSDEVMDNCFAVIAEATSQLQPGSVRALGICSQGEAFTAIGHNGDALCDAMISSDTRSDQFARTWPEEFGEQRLYELTGHTAHPMFSLFKLLWLKQNRPDVWLAAKKFLCFEDLLQMRLGVDPAIGWPLAGRTMLFDVRRHTWSDQILDRVGLAGQQLARPLPSGSVAGTVPGEIARRLGLADAALIVAAGHDQTCAALGAAVTEPGLAMYATGTVDCITPAFAAPIFSDELRRANLCTYDHAVPGMYATVAFSLTGGNILKWFRDQFGGEEVARAGAQGLDPYELLLRSALPRPTGLLVLPYFTASGTPYFDTRTKGAILGLRLTTTRGELLRALLEGVAMEMRLNLEILKHAGCEVRELRAVGGGAKSQFWTQLKADVLGKPITRLDVTEAGCLGAAMLACAADTRVPLADLARQWVRPVARCDPVPESADWYDRQFAKYRMLYQQISSIEV